MIFGSTKVFDSRSGLLTLVLTLFVHTLFAQQSISGRVVNAITEEGIPFVNIGFLKLGIGTVSNEDGEFMLEFNPQRIDDDAILQLSSLGYETKQMEYNSSSSLFNKYFVVQMNPKEVELMEVEVYNDGQEFISDNIGYRNNGMKLYGYWKGNTALGAELATRIDAIDGLRKLHELQFQVVENLSDSLLLRVNIYNDNGGKQRHPGTNLNNSGRSIFCMISGRGKQRITVDLDPYNIVVEDKFIISLELVEIYGDSQPGLALAATPNGFGTYRRYASQDKWERIANENMAYYLKTSVLVSEKLVDRYEKKETRKKKKARTISGFALSKGKMIDGVEVTNQRTGERVKTDNKGRYTIAAKNKDKVYFEKEGYKITVLTVGKNPTANIVMRGEN